MADQQPLVWNSWAEGIASSPHAGNGLIKSALIDAIPGALVPNHNPATRVLSSASSTFTADASTDICTGAIFTTSANTTGCAVTLTSTGTLPAGLATSTTYFVIRVDQNAGTFKLATSLANADAGTAIDITSAGSGTHTITPTAMGTMRHMVRSTSGTEYGVDSNGRVWLASGSTATFRLLTGNTLTNASGQGLALFTNSDATKTYLFVFRNAIIDVCDISGPTWTNGWQNLNGPAGNTNSHHAIVGQDNIIYACDTRYIVSIAEKAGAVFDPSSSATYTYTVQALDLPQGEVAEWLEELNINLLIAGKTYNRIYPWDRVSSSFSFPITLPEKGIYRLKNIGNTIFILAGLKGNIYTTQGATAQLFATLPQYVLSNGSSNLVAWGGIGVKAGMLIFGVSVVQNSSYSGVWGLYTDGRIVLESTPSAGATNATAFLDSDGDFYTFGYSAGADVLDTARVSSYATVAQSPLYEVGTKTKPAKFSEYEVHIDYPVAGSVRLGYRANLKDSFTTLATITTDTSNDSYKGDIGLIDLDNIQLQVELSNATGNGTSLLAVREVRLTP